MVPVAQPARFLRPDKNTFLWAQERVAWPPLKTFNGKEVYSRFGRGLLCLRYAEHVCSLWVVFEAGDVHGRTTPCPPEVKVEGNMWVWNWISVARLEWALKYVPVMDLLASAKYISLHYDNGLDG